MIKSEPYGRKTTPMIAKSFHRVDLLRLVVSRSQSKVNHNIMISIAILESSCMARAAQSKLSVATLKRIHGSKGLRTSEMLERMNEFNIELVYWILSTFS